MHINDIFRVKENNKKNLLKLKNVVGVGVGYKNHSDVLCVSVLVEKKETLDKLQPKDVIPEELDGTITDVVEVGMVRIHHARKKAVDRTGKHRPAPGGVSIGHVAITAGTLGCLVQDNDETEDIFILSNNHVLANSNDARQGDVIVQPGTVDGGSSVDQIGTLSTFVPINFGEGDSNCIITLILEWLLNLLGRLVGSSHRFKSFRINETPNRVDAALAWPLDIRNVSSEILEIGAPVGSNTAQLGDSVKKSGRTTGLTEGVIEQIGVTVQVQYGAGQIATFEDQLLAGPMSAGGDSGSVVLNSFNEVVGLLFAGSEQTTVINPIKFVLEELDVSIYNGR